MAQNILRFTLNGKKVEITVSSSKRLLDLLREDLALTGTKGGCGIGECGACTVLLDGRAVNACLILASLQPENAIVVEEAVTSGVGYYGMTASVPPFSLLTLTGGAIGQGMPCAVGAAMARPDRQVINFQADGSALYTLQALWMQAREGLNITTLICANQRYRILEAGIAQTGNLSPGVYTRALTNLSNPSINWVDLSKGMGVPAVSVETVEELTRHLGKSLNEPGPFLIEMRLG